MHIDTNAQNCNFLSVFVSLRGSLLCQWIVRCVVLSLPLYHSLFLFSNILMSEGVQNKDFLLTAGKWKRLFQNGRGKNVNCYPASGQKKGILGWGCLVCWRVFVFILFIHLVQIFTHGPRFLEGCKCDLIVCFHKQVSSHTANAQECQETSQPFSIKPSQTCCLSIVNLGVLAKLNMPDDTEMP